ncbi:hypothetical protein [Vibrio salinus]|uniref:hypothetical protein n=1 Tax=Vibrio salinus TaxID=2899784 RepID=UPI001E3E653C|nr:hypothetical protein [Vibrio salinus]MCE0494647.1 hypothetical protein [Vibrio salinus]
MIHFQSEKFKTMLFCDDRGIPLIMPDLFLYSLNRNKNVYEATWSTSLDQRRVKTVELKTVRVSNKTIIECSYELRKFLLWLNEFSENKNHISLDKHHNLPEEILNYYVNDILIFDKSKSEKMVEKSVSALRCYYNYLTYHGFTSFKNIEMKGANRGIARDNARKRNVVKYLSTRLRAELFANAHTLREECLLRAGAECGVRTEENTGFLLEDFKLGTTVYRGMKSLFKLLDDKSFNDKQEFEYWLQGKYSKSRKNGQGGKSRWIYIPRDVLQRFKLYFESERPDCCHNSLFVTASSNGIVRPIAGYQATRDFALVRERVIQKQNQGLLHNSMDVLQQGHTYHILRHSFGTDTFYEIAEENGLKIENVTAMDKPYLVVAELLGHETDGKYAPRTTRTYIRSVKEKMRQENIEYCL